MKEDIHDRLIEYPLDNKGWHLVFGKHNVTTGTHNEFYKFKNIFIRDNTGSYAFSTFDDFVNLKISSYNYSFADPTETGGDKSWGPTFKSMQLGFYVTITRILTRSPITLACLLS